MGHGSLLEIIRAISTKQESMRSTYSIEQPIDSKGVCIYTVNDASFVSALLAGRIPRTVSGKLVRDHFFTQSREDDTKWECKCGKFRTVRTGGGYRNFVQHVLSQHVADYNLHFTESEIDNTDNMSAALNSTSIFYRKTTHQL